MATLWPFPKSYFSRLIETQRSSGCLSARHLNLSAAPPHGNFEHDSIKLIDITSF